MMAYSADMAGRGGTLTPEEIAIAYFIFRLFLRRPQATRWYFSRDKEFWFEIW